MTRRTEAGKGRSGLIVLAAVAIISGIAMMLWQRQAPPVVPEISLPGADPTVVAAIETARGEVLAQPASDHAWGTLGMVLAAHGLRQPASECFARAEQLNPADPRWPYFLAATVDDPGRELPALERAVAIGANEPTPRLALADRLIGEGDGAAAEQHYRAVLAVDPGHPRALTGLARVHFDRGEHDTALELLTAAGERPPDVRERQLLLAQVYMRLGRRDEALAAQRQADALRRSPGWPDPYGMELLRHEVGATAMRRRIMAMRRAGLRDQAEQLADRAIALHPDDGLLLIEHATVVGGTQRFADAEASLRRAMELGHDDAGTQFRLGYALYWQGKREGAEAAFRAALERAPENFGANLMLGMVLQDAGELSQAARFYQLALEIEPDNAEARQRLDTLRQAAGDGAASNPEN